MRLTRLITIAGAVVFALSSTVFGLTWEIYTIEPVLECADGVSIDLDSADHPHISYANNSIELKHAYYDGTSWDIYLVDDEGSELGTSITLDSSDNPHLSYADLNWKIKYAYYDGSDWQIELPDPASGFGAESSIVIDSAGRPHISYLEGALGINTYIKYAYYNGTSWHFTDIYDPDPDENLMGLYSSIALDSSDTPHIISTRGAPYESEYLYYFVGPDFDATFVDSANHDTDCSIALDSSDNVHVSYGDGDELKYGYYDGSEWDITTVETLSNINSTSLALDDDGNPHIAYNSSSVNYAYFDGSAWRTTEVEDPGVVCYGSSIAVDYIVGDDDIKYALCTGNNPPSSFNLVQPPDGAEVPEPVTFDWENSTDDDGDTITYDVWYATDPSFDPHDEVNELTDSTYTFPEGTFSDGTTYYWKVRAWDGYDETWSGPDDYWSFTVEEELTGISVAQFSAESARAGIELTWECADPGVGFNLYRSEEALGMRTKSREMLNAEPITGESPYTYLDAGVSDGVTYAYWLEAMDVGGAGETFGPVNCTAGSFIPTSYALYQSRPNPARGTAVIAFDLPEDADVTLTIYDLSGRKVTTLVNETLPAGAYERPVAGLAPGVYVYRLLAGEFSGVKKMVVVE
jgi:hypothetical protein